MNLHQREVADIVHRDGLIRRSQHPHLASQIAWLARSGRLSQVLHDVYLPATLRDDPARRMLAAGRALPDGVLLGDAAARLGYAPDHRVELIEIALGYGRADVVGYRFRERRIEPELVTDRSGIRYTVPALTALDLAESSEGSSIDEVLRRRAATLAGLHRALELSPGRRGNRMRRRLLLDSRDEPWSAAERLFHQLLRRLGYVGWRANYRVVVAGRVCYLDVAFPGLRVAIEIDGQLVHSTPDAFEQDRHRQNALVAAGWRVVRFTWAMLQDAALVEHVLRSVLGNPR